MQGRERKINDKTLLEVKNDKNGSLLFTAIEQGNVERLEDLIFHGANVYTSIEDGYILLQFAAQQEQWGCVLTLINEVVNNKHKYDYIWKNFYCSVGLPLLLAAKHNRNEVIAALVQLVQIIPEFYSPLREDIFFKLKPNWPTITEGLWKDEEKSYTALQWAVENNNPEICQFHAMFVNSADHKIYRVKDNNDLNALSSAIRKNHLQCAQEIAKGMSIQYMLESCPDDVICRVTLDDFQFRTYKIEHPGGNLKFWYKHGLVSLDGLIDTKIQLILKQIFSLSNEDKKSAIRLALRNETTLGQIIRNSDNSKQYERQLTNELEKILKEESPNKLSYSTDKETSRSKFVSLNSESNDFELVPLYIKTTDLYARLPNVPKHKVMADAKSSSLEDEVPLIRKVANRNVS